MIGSNIRKAKYWDLEAICRLWQEMMDFHGERDAHFTRAHDGHERFGTFIAAHIASDDSLVLLAEHEGQIVAYCLATLAQYPPVFEDKNYGSILDLAVTKQYRRHGIGEAMFRRVRSWFAERNLGRIELRVAVSNEISTAFWRKMGFLPYMMTVFRDITY